MHAIWVASLVLAVVAGEVVFWADLGSGADAAAGVAMTVLVLGLLAGRFVWATLSGAAWLRVRNEERSLHAPDQASYLSDRDWRAAGWNPPPDAPGSA